MHRRPRWTVTKGLQQNPFINHPVLPCHARSAGEDQDKERFESQLYLTGFFAVEIQMIAVNKMIQDVSLSSHE